MSLTCQGCNCNNELYTQFDDGLAAASPTSIVPAKMQLREHCYKCGKVTTTDVVLHNLHHCRSTWFDKHSVHLKCTWTAESSHRRRIGSSWCHLTHALDVHNAVRSMYFRLLCLRGTLKRCLRDVASRCHDAVACPNDVPRCVWKMFRGMNQAIELWKSFEAGGINTQHMRSACSMPSDTHRTIVKVAKTMIKLQSDSLWWDSFSSLTKEDFECIPCEISSVYAAMECVRRALDVQLDLEKKLPEASKANAAALAATD